MTALRGAFHAAFPAGDLLAEGDADAAARVLAAAGLPAEVRRVERAGAGNMNLVLRAHTSRGPVILKQARPWVERYPAIAAPVERSRVEAAFYRAVSRCPPVADAMPRLLGEAPASGVLVLEDLGPVRDLSRCYDEGPLPEPAALFAVRYLRALHGVCVQDAALRNPAMRVLNHRHVFVLPLAGEGGVDLDAITPGLCAAAARLREDAAFVAACAELGERYLADGPALLHGDPHPGSFVESPRGLKAIDPEFCFGGPPEFDLAVLVAHMVMAGHGPSEAWRLAGEYGPFERRLAERFAGVEITRRLIGVAQLPLRASLDRKASWLDCARAMVLAAR